MSKASDMNVIKEFLNLCSNARIGLINLLEFSA